MKHSACRINRRDPESNSACIFNTTGEPVHYPVSCSPQAWASGAPIVILTGLPGLNPDASSGELRILNPRLPEFVTFLEVRNLRVGKSQLDLDFLRQGDRTSCRVVRRTGEDLAVSITYL